ncbi:MAG: hypothetical protein ACTSXU_14755 [Promethearchaeota archaeon]
MMMQGNAKQTGKFSFNHVKNSRKHNLFFAFTLIIFFENPAMEKNDLGFVEW